jgi:hypothetical protein
MEKDKALGPRTLKDTLEKILSEAQGKSDNVLARISQAWQEYGNTAVKQHVVINKFNQGALFLTVDTTTWLYEIEHKYKKEILAELQNTVGAKDIKKIILTVGALGRP